MRNKRVLLAPLPMAVAVAFFALNDAGIKWLSVRDGLPLFQILVVRNAFITVIFFCICLASLGWQKFLVEAFKPGYFLYAMSEVVMALPYIYALKLLPLQTAQPIVQLSPLFAVLIGVLFLGRRSNWQRWLAIGFGFSGVLAIVNPVGGFDVSWLIFLPMVTAFVAGLRDAVTNRFGAKLNPLVVAFSMAWTILAVMGVAQIFEIDGAWQPIDGTAMIVFAVLCGAVSIGYVARVIAIQHSEISVIAPIFYTGMIWAMLFGAIVFGDPIGLGQVLGAGLIAVGGLILIWFDPLKTTRLTQQVAKP